MKFAEVLHVLLGSNLDQSLKIETGNKNKCNPEHQEQCLSFS